MTYARLSDGPDRAVRSAILGNASGIAIATAGSTGTPREVLLGAAAMEASVAATHARLGGPGQWVLALPTDHVAGAMVLARCLIAHTDPISVGPGPFTASLFAEATERLGGDRPSYVSLVPTQLTRLLATDMGRDALARYAAVLVGGAALTASEVPDNVVRTYGMTETAGGCVYDGLPLDGVTVHVAEDHHIIIAGPTLADGYADGDTSAWVTHDGERALRTRDLGQWRDGALEVWGRADDVIITGGYNVHPIAVERALARVPGVVSVAVVPVPDPQWGQRIVAVMECEAPVVAPTLDDVRDAVGDDLKRHELPKAVVVVEKLPRLSSGKIDRNAVAAMVAAPPPLEDM